MGNNNHTYAVLVRAHVLCKFRATQFIGAKKAEVTRHLPHDGGSQSLVETQGTTCFQHSLHDRPRCAGVTAQNTVRSVKTKCSARSRVSVQSHQPSLPGHDLAARLHFVHGLQLTFHQLGGARHHGGEDGG